MKSVALVRVVWAMGLVLPVVAAAAPGAASACGTLVYREIDSSSQLVAKAEQALSEGKLGSAATKAVQAFPALKIIKPGSVPLADRAIRIVALASVRSDGGIGPAASTTKAGPERAANLEWSIGALRVLTAKRFGNPSYQTDLGEALSKVPEHHAEALKILADLSDRDLLTTAEGYASLARLRAEAGDATAHDAAVKRCENMTKTPQICATPAVAAGNGQT
jgi:hypothetical protein